MSLDKKIENIEQELAQIKHQLNCLPFCLKDEEGNNRVEVSADSKGVSLKFYNTEGKLALCLGVDGTDSGFLAIKNAEEKVVAKLDVESYGARLELLDAHWGGDGSVVMHGNDCNNEGGWIKTISGSGDQELFINSAGIDKNI